MTTNDEMAPELTRTVEVEGSTPTGWREPCSATVSAPAVDAMIHDYFSSIIPGAHRSPRLTDQAEWPAAVTAHLACVD